VFAIGMGILLSQVALSLKAMGASVGAAYAATIVSVEAPIFRV